MSADIIDLFPSPPANDDKELRYYSFRKTIESYLNKFGFFCFIAYSSEIEGLLDYLKYEDTICLNFGTNYSYDLYLGDSYLEQTLVFNGVSCLVKLPYRSIIAYSSRKASSSTKWLSMVTD